MITVETIQSLNHLLAIGGIIVMLTTIVLIYDLNTRRRLQNLLQAWGLLVVFIASMGASVMSLIYSEIFGIVPCGLCWFERIMLYPQVLLLGTALYYKDKLAPRYGIVLSVSGLIISLYHHWIQMGGTQFVKCPAAGAVDCAKRFFFEFDFMTFPLLSAILFAFLIVIYFYILKTKGAD